MSSSAPVAIVTGAARGMGAATSARLAARGVEVVLVDLPLEPHGRVAPVPRPYVPAHGEDLDEAAARCEGHGHPFAADVRDGAALAHVVTEVIDRFGRLDIVVAAAGAVAGGTPLWETDDDTWRAMIDINLTGVFELARATVPAMLASPSPRRGRFVAVASAAAHHGLPQLAAYTAAKHGVAGLTKALAAELADRGIAVNAVCPGSTATVMLDASAAIYGLSSAEEFAGQARIGRLIDPDEIAATIEWLCCDAPDAMTGSIIDVDGGFRA